MFRRSAHTHPSTLAAALTAMFLVTGSCTFDPLAGWEPPRFGSLTVGDAIGPGGAGDGAAPGADLGPLPLRIDRLVPDRGDPAGDEPIVIHGGGFTGLVEVWFGEREGLYAQAQDGERIFVRTPPGEPGLADVRVVRIDDGRFGVLAGGFLYGRPVRVHAVEPTHGPAIGGTPLVIRGEGFLEGTVAVLGGRLLVGLELVDEGTIIGVTPGGLAGPADVIVSNVVGSVRARGAFHYDAALAVTSVEPFLGPTGGGAEVVVHGSGFGPSAGVRFGGVTAELLGWAADGASLRVRVPAGPPGHADVRVTVPGAGEAELREGYLRRDDPANPASLVVRGVFPPEGDARGGDRVAVAVGGLREPTSVLVTFGESAAELLSYDASTSLLHVRTPPGPAGSLPGTVIVAVRDAGATAFLSDAFRYVAPFGPVAIEPTDGPAGGGTELTVRGEGFTAGARVRLGPLYASDVQVEDPQTIRCTTPPGSPGLTDVLVEQAGRRARLAGAYTYTWGGTALFAMDPTQGAIAGGTYVELYGADFPVRPMVRFGNRVAPIATRISPSHVVAYSPPTPAPESVDVGVLGPQGTGILSRGYTYFDPRGAGPGTWGDPIENAVNVTVLDARTDEPVPNAFTMLDDAPDTPYRGWTNANGQVTLSGPGLRGPRDVTAAALGYSAATYVAIDAENVIIELVMDNPPSTSPPTSAPLPDGGLKGQVEGGVKYVPLPRASCDDRPPDDAPLCQPCASDEDCADVDASLPDPRCTPLGEDGLRCTVACGEGCPSGYACAPLDGDARCVPSPGERRVRCEVTRRSLFWPAETGPDDVDPDTAAYEVGSRLGEVAVVCIGGYEDETTGVFVPLRMGIRRHAYVESARVTDGQDIVLDIPLTRTVRFRLDPARPAEGEPSDTVLSVYLDLGSDGVYVLAEDLAADDEGTALLPYVPERFAGSLYDAGLTVFAGRYTADDPLRTPYAETYQDRLGDAELVQPQVLSEDGDASWRSEDVASARQPLAVWQTRDGDRLLVGESGLLLWSTGPDVWWPQPNLGRRNLNDIHGDGADHVVVAGDGGSVYRFDGLRWEALPPPTSRDLRGVWVAGPERFVAVGDHRIVEYDRGDWTVRKVAADLYAVSGRHWEAVWAVGRDGAMLSRTAAGWQRSVSPTAADLLSIWLAPESVAGIAAGAGGELLHLDDGAWEPAEPEVEVDVDLWDVHGRSGQDVTVVGDHGTVLRFDGATWRREETGVPEATLLSVHAHRDGAWTAVGPRAVPIGPLLPTMRFAVPGPDQIPWNRRQFRWSIDDEAAPETRATLISIGAAMGGTRWRIVAPGHLRAIDLPDLVRAAGFTPLPADALVVRAQTALWPTFDIDRLRGGSVSYNDWISWTYHYLTPE